CRSRMPVRGRIHSSFVSTIFSMSRLVTTRGGTYPATPVIFAAMRLPITHSILSRIVRDCMQSRGRVTSKTVRAAPHRLLRGWRHDFVAVGDLRGLPEHRRHGTILVLAQLDRVTHCFFFQRSRKAVHDFNPCPNLGRLLRALARDAHLE